MYKLQYIIFFIKWRCFHKAPGLFSKKIIIIFRKTFTFNIAKHRTDTTQSHIDAPNKHNLSKYNNRIKICLSISVHWDSPCFGCLDPGVSWQQLIGLSLIHSPPSQQRCYTPAAVWPLSRMQLWIFTSQRDNEVSSRANNEPVLLPRGSWGLWLPEQPNISKDIPLSLIGYRLLSTSLTCARGVSTVS